MSDQRLITALIAGACIWLTIKLAPILTPFVIAGLLAYLGDPLVDRLQRLKLQRTSAVVVTFLLMFFFLASVFLLIVPMVRDQGSALASKFPEYIKWVEGHWLPTIKDWLNIDGNSEVGLASLMEGYGDKIGGFLTGALGTVGRSGGALISTAVNIILIPVLTFYLMRDYDLLVARFGALVPPARRPRVFQIAKESDAALSNFLKGQTVVMLGLAIIWSVGLTIVGLEYALAIGVLAGILSFVPYLGPATGILLGGISAMVQSPDLLMLGGVAIVFVFSQLVENYYLTPRFVGNRIGLHPVMVIFSVMAGGQLFGFFGVLLALPVSAVVTVLLRHFYEMYGPTDNSLDLSDEKTILADSVGDSAPVETPSESDQNSEPGGPASA